MKPRDEGKTEEEYENPDKLFKSDRGQENPSPYDHYVDQPVYTTIDY